MLLSVSTSHLHFLLISDAPCSSLPADLCLGHLIPPHGHLGQDLRQPPSVPQEIVMHPLSQQTLGMQAISNILLSFLWSKNSQALDFTDLRPTLMSISLKVQETHGLLKYLFLRLK